MALTMKALGHLAYLALACALVLYGDWKYRRSGTRGLWRDWVILATVVTGAFTAASVVFYGPGQMEPVPSMGTDSGCRERWVNPPAAPSPLAHRRADSPHDTTLCRGSTSGSLENRVTMPPPNRRLKLAARVD